MPKISNSNQHKFELVYAKSAHKQFVKKCAKMGISISDRLRQLIAADIGKKSVIRG